MELVAARKKIMVQNPGNKNILRMIDLRQQTQVTFYLAIDRMLDVMSIKVPQETDLVRKRLSIKKKKNVGIGLLTFLNDF